MKADRVVIWFSVIALFVVTALIGWGGYRIFAYPLCGEKMEREPAVSLAYTNTPIPLSSTDHDVICDTIIGLEDEDPHRTSCDIKPFGPDDSFYFVEVTRTSECTNSLLGRLAKISYFGVLTNNTIYPIYNVKYYSSNPSTDTEFIDLSIEQFEALSHIETAHHQATFDGLVGKYLFYWLDSQGMECSDMELSDGAAIECLVQEVDARYPDEDYDTSLIELFEYAPSCEEVWVLGRKNRAYNLDDACATYNASLNGDVDGCLSAKFGNDINSTFNNARRCFLASDFVLTPEFCDGQDERSRCYMALAWQELDEGYCEEIKHNHNYSTEKDRALCIEEVEALRMQQ